MLAAVRSYWFVSFLTALLVAGALPPAAQSQAGQSQAGQPLPSSFSFVRGTVSSPGASLSTFGPNGYSNILQPLGCCADSFIFPHFPEPKPPLAPAPPAHHHHKDNSGTLPIAVPVYVPYAVGYVPDSGDAAPDAADDDAAADSDPEQDQPPVHRHGEKKRAATEEPDASAGEDAAGNAADGMRMEDSGERDTSADAEAGAAPLPDPPAEPVVSQPTTVLVFKDGHRAEVVNYAILGDTLFDFADGRTHKILLMDLDLAATQKANDALGVEFKLPPENFSKDDAN